MIPHLTIGVRSRNRSIPYRREGYTVVLACQRCLVRSHRLFQILCKGGSGIAVDSHKLTFCGIKGLFGCCLCIGRLQPVLCHGLHQRLQALTGLGIFQIAKTIAGNLRCRLIQCILTVFVAAPIVPHNAVDGHNDTGIQALKVMAAGSQRLQNRLVRGVFHILRLDDQFSVGFCHQNKAVLRSRQRANRQHTDQQQYAQQQAPGSFLCFSFHCFPLSSTDTGSTSATGFCTIWYGVLFVQWLPFGIEAFAFSALLSAPCC